MNEEHLLIDETWKRFLILLSFNLFNLVGLSIPATASVTEDPDEDFDEDDDSTEADDDGRIYKNPRNHPSLDCPRDEEQATLLGEFFLPISTPLEPPVEWNDVLGQKCLRKCSSDEDCKSKKKKCLCDGACGMSCIKPDRECPELQHPPLGTVVMSGRTFGSRASYTCNHGYHVVGLQSRICQAYGRSHVNWFLDQTSAFNFRSLERIWTCVQAKHLLFSAAYNRTRTSFRTARTRHVWLGLNSSVSLPHGLRYSWISTS